MEPRAQALRHVPRQVDRDHQREHSQEALGNERLGERGPAHEKLRRVQPESEHPPRREDHPTHHEQRQRVRPVHAPVDRAQLDDRLEDQLVAPEQEIAERERHGVP